MSIAYSGTFTKSAGLISAIAKQVKLVNLTPIKRIRVKFDPFHQNAILARDFLFHINTPAVQNTNLNCIIKANVVCDRSEPEIKIDLNDSRFLGNHLTAVEVLQLINKHISSKVVVEEVNIPQTKSTKVKKGRR